MSQSGGRDLCPELISDLVPGLNGGLKKDGLAHVEIRRCAPAGELQLLAWAAGAKDPVISIGLARFSADRILVDENIVVVIFSGGYDSIEAIEYKGGVPKVVLEDSVRGIQLMSDWDRVVITLFDRKGRKTVKTLHVDRGGLEAPK